MCDTRGNRVANWRVQFGPHSKRQVSKSVGGGIDADLNKSSGGRPIFLCVARNPTAAPVTAVAVVFGASGEFFPPGISQACSLPGAL